MNEGAFMIAIAAGVVLGLLCLMVIPYAFLFLFGILLHLIGFIFKLVLFPFEYVKNTVLIIREKWPIFKKWWDDGCFIRFTK